MMRIAHLCDGSVAGDYFRNIAAGSVRHGFELTLIELRTGTPTAWLAEFPDVKYVTLGADAKLAYPAAIRRLRKLLIDDGIDILHTHLFYSGLIGTIACRRVPTCTSALMRHHTSVVKMLGTPVHTRLDRWMAETADHVMTVSEAAKRYMTDVDGIRRDDIEVVYLGFDFDRLKADEDLRRRTRTEFGFDDNDLVIGYIANFAVGKGHVQLINAFDEIKRRFTSAKLLLVGVGKLIEVEDTVGRLALGRRIVFAGWRDDIPACLNAMDIFVQPSLSEAFSQVLIEAMGCGVPVVATRVGGADEVVRSRENGILIEPDDVGQIVDAVTELINYAEFRNAIAATGAADVREKFTADVMVERHVELYNRWAARK